MTEIPVGELTGFDIGRRVILTYEGAGITGMISNFAWIHFGSKRGVELFKLEVAVSDKSTFTLSQVPLDYRIQIDRTEATE